MHICDASVFEKKKTAEFDSGMRLWNFIQSLSIRWGASSTLVKTDLTNIFNNHKPCVCIQFHQAYQNLDLQ